MPLVALTASKKRRNRRLKAFQPGILKLGDEERRFHLIDVSPTGASCHMELPPAVGQEIIIDLLVRPIRAKVVWVTDARFGIAFTQLIDMIWSGESCGIGKRA